MTDPRMGDESLRRAMAPGMRGAVGDELDGRCEVFLVRHGQQEATEFSALGRGSLYDPPLSERGMREAAAVAERLASATIHAVYTSPLIRARATAGAIAGRHRLVPIVEDDLRELNLWERLEPGAEIADLYSREALGDLWRNSVTTRKYSAFPHAEDMEAFKDRLAAAIARIAEAHANQRVVLACHGGVINGYLSRLFESPLDVLVAVRNASITIARIANGETPLVLAVNDTAHLAGLDP